eukprot:7465081-Karenia_brevis.AAC.1
MKGIVATLGTEASCPRPLALNRPSFECLASRSLAMPQSHSATFPHSTLLHVLQNHKNLRCPPATCLQPTLYDDDNQDGHKDDGDHDELPFDSDGDAKGKDDDNDDRHAD